MKFFISTLVAFLLQPYHYLFVAAEDQYNITNLLAEDSLNVKSGFFGKQSLMHTPSGEFLVTFDDCCPYIFLPNRKDKMTYLNGDYDEVSSCNAAGCYGEFYSASVLGRKSDYGFRMTLAATDWDDVRVMCPFGKMTLSVTDARCAGQTSSIMSTVTVASDGPFLRSISKTFTCPTNEFYFEDMIEFDVECVADERSEYKLMLAASTKLKRLKNSFGNVHASSGRRNIWMGKEDLGSNQAVWVNGIDTFLELIGFDMSSDSSACTTTGCNGDDWAALIHGPDKNSVEIFSNSHDDFFETMTFICPYGDQTPYISITSCEGDASASVTMGENSRLGPIVKQKLGFDISCSADVVGIKFSCK